MNESLCKDRLQIIKNAINLKALEYLTKRIIAAISLLIVTLTATGGNYDYFHHMRTGSEEIRALYPDADGRVWIGTIHGLMRYGDFPIEGSNHYDYYPERFKAGINSIQDFDGERMLIRTLDDGRFVIYNPHTNLIEGNFDNLLEQWGIKCGNRWSLSIKTDRHNNLWFYADGNLFLHRAGDSGSVKAAEVPQQIKNLSVTDDEFCILTDSHIYVYSMANFSQKAKIDNIENKDVRSQLVALDGDGNVWVSGDNLSRYDRKLGRWESVRPNILITDMVVSKSGEVLVATNTSGILRFGPDGTELQKIRHVPYDPTSLAADNIRWIIEDNDTTLWVCYDKRIISACNPTDQYPALRHIPSLKSLGLDDDIISVTQDADGTVWLGSNGHGVYCMDANGTSFEVPAPLEALKTTAVSALYTDSRDRVWIGTFRNGLYCYDHGKVKAFLPQMSVYSILEDKSGRIWLGLLGGGIRYLDSDLAHEPAALGAHNREWISNMIYDGKNDIYASSSNGIIAIDTKTMESRHIDGNRSGSQQLKNRNFQSSYRDSRGLLWHIGLDTDSPVEIYDPACDSIIYIPRLKDNIVKSIIEDDNKNIWMASEHAIIHIIVNYDVNSGCYAFIPALYRFQNSADQNDAYYNYRAAAMLSDGKLLFGSSDGFLVVNPTDFPPFTSELFTPRLYITSIKVNNNYLKAANLFNGRDIITEDIPNLDKIVLNHDENNIIITVGSKDFATGYYRDLYYRLDGRDSEWRQIRGNVIDLPNLSPGNYSLQIGSEKADGTIAGNTIAFGIRIKSPWYSTWVAWAIYVAITLVLILCAIYYYIDRQKQKLYVAEIKKEAERQYHLNEMKLRFFTNISHDFRTPLSLIITPLETFMNDEANESAVKHLQPVYKNALRLLDLINQILDFRKIDINGAVLNLSYGDIVSFVRDICSSFTLFAEDTAKQISFTSAEPSVNMYFDKDKVTKIMMNLLSNSFKFTPSGSEVRVALNVDGENVKISVADNGCGIPDDKKERIFDRFYQSDTPPADYIGSGIGLHIVKEFVSLHNGTITVADNQPTGTVFTVSLPILKSNQSGADETQPMLVAETVEGEEPKPDKVNLLIVEDNSDFRQYMKDQLEGEYNVFTAINGIEALERLEENEIRIIVSDIMMDGMDGLELCRKVKSNLTTSHIPVILLTAKALPEDEIRGLECGADEYVTKPFNMNLLKRRIRKLLDDSMKSQRKFKEKLDVNPSEITITSLDEQFLSSAIKCVEENMASPDFSVETMSGMLGVHRTQLYKKLISLTGKAPADFIRLIRLKRAAQYLAKSQMFVSEIAYTVGFSSPKLFTKHFKEEFGVSPRDYQNKYSGSGPEPNDQTT